MRKSEIVRKQKDELDRFREVFAIAMQGDDIESVKELKLKLEIMQKRHEMERKTWGIADSTKAAESSGAAKGKKISLSPELREKLNEIYGSAKRE